MAETLKEYKTRIAKSGGEARKAQKPNYSAMGKKGMKHRWNIKNKKKREKLKKFLFG